jgi:hypothetical protein
MWSVPLALSIAVRDDLLCFNLDEVQPDELKR